MRLPVLTSLACLIGSIGAFAQSAPQNMLIKQWPIIGKWHVLLVRARSLNGAPSCLLLTGYPSTSEPLSRTWGLRSAGTELLLIVNARKMDEASGTDVTVAVAGNQLGSFPVTDRPASVGGLSTAVASVRSPSARERILRSVQVDRSIRFTLGTRSVEETFDRTSVIQFEECRHEFDLLS